MTTTDIMTLTLLLTCCLAVYLMVHAAVDLVRQRVRNRKDP